MAADKSAKNILYATLKHEEDFLSIYINIISILVEDFRSYYKKYICKIYNYVYFR